MATPDLLTSFRVVLLGAGATGKSALSIRLVADEFRQEYDPTIEETYTKILNVDGRTYPCDVLDTGGQEHLVSLQDHWIRDSHIFLLIYSVNDRRSFQNAQGLYQKILRIKGDSTYFSLVLLGNKADLPSSLREIIYDEGKAMAENITAAFYETSAKTGYNVTESFQDAIRRFLSLDHTLSDEIRRVTKPGTATTNTCHCICLRNCGKGDRQRLFAESEFKDHGYHLGKAIKFFEVNKLPEDEIRTPVLALKNFKIRRRFHIRTMCISMLCGAFLPVVVIIQTILFLGYSESREALYSKIYPKSYAYDDVHTSLILDYLGMVVGRNPGQDPECVKDMQWFMMQTPAQLVQRVVMTVCICIGYILCCYNVYHRENEAFSVSLMETVCPILLFWVLWSLLSVWIGYELHLVPGLPSLSRLRSIWLFFGEEFTHQSSAYKYLRAYSSSRYNKWMMSPYRKAMVLVLGLLYAAVPGVTRSTFGDSSDQLHEKLFFSSQGFAVQFGALFVNFLLIASFVYALEVQYSKHFDNYRKYMHYLTMLLTTEDSEMEEEETHEELSLPHAHSPRLNRVTTKDRLFAKQLFLSLTRRSNALGWLEIRSFLAVEGKILFGEQELPTLWLLVLAVSLALFVLYRVYLMEGNPLQSVLFNGTVVLCIICLVSLLRIANTGHKFETLQDTQVTLLGEQKFFMRCSKHVRPGKAGSLKKQKTRYNTMSVVESKTAEEVQSPTFFNEKYDPETGLITRGGLGDSAFSLKVDADEPLLDRANTVHTSVVRNRRINKEMDKETSRVIADNVDTIHWYAHNVGFIDDLIEIVRNKDIYPRMFKVKLNAVLLRVIAGIFFTGIITLFKLFTPS
eukprot:18542_1